MSFDWDAICSATSVTTATAAAAVASAGYGPSSLSASSELTARFAATTLSTEAPDGSSYVLPGRVRAMGSSSRSVSRPATCCIPGSMILSMHLDSYPLNSIIGQAIARLRTGLYGLEAMKDIALNFILGGYEGYISVKDFMIIATQESPNLCLYTMDYYQGESVIEIVYAERNVGRVSFSPARDFPTGVSRDVPKPPPPRGVSAPSLTSAARSDVRPDKSQPDVLLRSPNSFEVLKSYLLQADKPPKECVLTVFRRSLSMTTITLSTNKVLFVFEGITAQESTEFMTYVTSPDFRISQIKIGEITHVECQKFVK